MRANKLSYERTAGLLRVSIFTLRNWMKPAHRNDAPEWAVDLFHLKTGAALPPWMEETR